MLSVNPNSTNYTLHIVKSVEDGDITTVSLSGNQGIPITQGKVTIIVHTSHGPLTLTYNFRPVPLQ